MQILEYKLHASLNTGMICPPFIENGGYWRNPDDFTYIGVSPDSNEYYIPDTVTKLTLAELKTRQLAIHAKYPTPRFHFDEDQNAEDNPHLTNDEVESSIDKWWEGVQ